MRCSPLLVLTLAATLPLAAEDRKPAPPTPPEPVASEPAEGAEVADAKVGFLGIGLDEVDDTLAYHLNLENDLGVLITQVAAKSPAQAMGLKRHDVIVAADGKPIYTPRALQNLIRAKKTGETVEITVRRGPASETLSGKVVTRTERPGESRPPQGRRMGGGPGEAPPRHGRMPAPDGGTMEWSVEESP